MPDAYQVVPSQPLKPTQQADVENGGDESGGRAGYLTLVVIDARRPVVFVQ